MGKTKMKFLSRPEELVLLAVWRLKENAYCVPIKKQLVQSTDHDWSFGAVYDPLDRLEKKGFLESYLSDPTAKRGGKRKRIYKLTPNGILALIEIKKITDEVWEGIHLKALKDEL
jgi:DNA-binding PadR family transcriptional regulator